MIRLIMQVGSDEPNNPLPGLPVSGPQLNLNYRVFDINCPELEKALKGETGKKLTLLGMEVVVAPVAVAPAVSTTATTNSSAIVPYTNGASTPLTLKQRLQEKHGVNGHKHKVGLFGRILGRGPEKVKALPLPT